MTESAAGVVQPGPWPVRVRITVVTVAATAIQNTQVTTVASVSGRVRGARLRSFRDVGIEGLVMARVTTGDQPRSLI